MEMPDNPADLVIAALQEHDLSVKRDEIESAFNDKPATLGNAKWVSEHLNCDTLLSKEELTLYQKLEGSGALQDILHSSDIDATRPFLDGDIQSAIESLKASTTTIQKQTEILTSQCESLNKQIRLENERGSRRARDLVQLRKKHESGRQNINVATGDMIYELDRNLKNETDLATTEGKRVLSSVKAKLKEDDRTLASLERLVSGIKSTGDDGSAAQIADQLSIMVADYVSQEMHYRLDRLYLETIRANHPSTSSSTGDEEEILAALEEELESLYPEIGVLADMSTKQQFREPILRGLQDRHGQLRINSRKRLEQALDAIIEMKSSIEGLTERLRARESFRETLQVLASVYQSEVGPQLSDNSSRRETLTRSLGTSMLSSSPRKPNVQLPVSQALESLLRRLGLSSEAVFESQSETGGERMLQEKKLHLVDCLRNLFIAADSPLVAQLLPSDRASQLLSSALHADSCFGVSLSDSSQEDRLTALESQLGLVQRGLEGLNLDVLYQRDKNLEKFMGRWL